MPTGVYKRKWALKYDRCIRCGTKKIKHGGKGLCRYCCHRKWRQGTKGKELQKISREKWYSSVKGTKKYRKYNKIKFEEWKKTTGYRLWNQRWLTIRKFERFIERKEMLKRDLGGIKFRCSGCDKKCLIISPIKELKKHKMYEFDLFKEVLIKNCKKNKK